MWYRHTWSNRQCHQFRRGAPDQQIWTDMHVSSPANLGLLRQYSTLWPLAILGSGSLYVFLIFLIMFNLLFPMGCTKKAWVYTHIGRRNPIKDANNAPYRQRVLQLLDEDKPGSWTTHLARYIPAVIAAGPGYTMVVLVITTIFI